MGTGIETTNDFLLKMLEGIVFDSYCTLQWSFVTRHVVENKYHKDMCYNKHVMA